MDRQWKNYFLCILVVSWWSVSACSPDYSAQSNDHSADASLQTNSEELTIDAATGIPYALIFQFPIRGFDTADFGFGFGSINSNFCLVSDAAGCKEYGAHTGRDTIVGHTPIGTEVLAPADGIVRVTTDRMFRAFGSDSAANEQYSGCVVVLEHEFANGQHITTLLGHLACESSTPRTGTIVRRGDVIGHVTHYWHGSDMSTDWHHLHWGMRRGAYSTARLNDIVRGYISRSTFTLDRTTNSLKHSSYLDPFVVIAANYDPAMVADETVLHHPPGSLLEDEGDGYWIVADRETVRSLSSDVVRSDRYDVTKAVRVTAEEMSCYGVGSAVVSRGHVTVYQRPGSSTVVVAYDESMSRYDVIRWEALLSWGFGSADLITDQNTIARLEQSYTLKGMQLLRPGVLVKADESSEVSIVTPQQTRIPIVSGEVFERLGYRWEHVVSIPQSVIDRVAGPRELPMIDQASTTRCEKSECPAGEVCGGGGAADDQIVDDYDATIHLSYTGGTVSGAVSLQAWWQPPNAVARQWGTVSECRDSNTSDKNLECTFFLPHGTMSFEFQILLSNGQYWGDTSCDSGGGCHNTVGTVTLSVDGASLEYVLRPNNSSGQPYFNGLVDLVL